VFTLTGKAAGLKAKRKVSAGVGVFSMVGKTVSLSIISAFQNSKNNPVMVDSIGGRVLVLGDSRIDTWGSSSRPTSPKLGSIGFNIEISKVEIYNGTAWKSIELT
jgi:hypothetical protein